MNDTYVHGYHDRENERLHDQAGTLVELLHADTAYPPRSLVLEAGCGVGAQPAAALSTLRSMLRPCGTITLIEGDHGSTYFHLDSAAAHEAIQCQVTLQRAAGGNALIGRQVYPLLVNAGFESVRVSPRMVYVDASRPDLAGGFTRKTFTAMIEGVREPAILGGLIQPERFDAGIRDLLRTTEQDGVFCYTFFKGVGVKAR